MALPPPHDWCVFLHHFDLPAFIAGQVGVAIPHNQTVLLPEINQCFCINNITAYTDTNPALQYIASLSSIEQVDTVLTELVDYYSEALYGKVPCSYPVHSQEACTEVDHCGFTCIDGYSAATSGHECVCNAPNIVCGNGQCADTCPAGFMSERSVDDQRKIGQISSPSDKRG